MSSFDEFNLDSNLHAAIKKLGFSEPTQIQAKSIPLVLQGKDVIGESATGSGKTLAFACGVLKKAIPGRGIQALILTPTRELAEQVKNMILELATGKGLRISSIYGGVSMNPQYQALKNSEVIIATPGRLKDHLQRKTVDLRRVNILVLDEADRMLDMGFIDDIELIIRSCPTDRQTLLFSATFLPEIEKLAQKYIRNAIKVSAVRHVDPSKLKQAYYDVPRNLKISLLLHLLEKETAQLVMVFCNTRRSTDMVCKNLKANRVDAVAIHGGFSQNNRMRAIQEFSKGKTEVLVCTDVAGRGLHIDNVSHIYNYEVPNDPIDYIHRIGRTARAGEEGIVINLISDYDHDNFSRIMRSYAFKIEKRERPFLKSVIVRKDEPRERHGPRGYGPRETFGRERGSGPRAGGFRRRNTAMDAHLRYG